MTETMTAEPGYGSDDNEVARPIGGTFEHLSPTALTLGDNVRDNVALDKAFLASIKEHGVLTPVTAVRAADGTTITVRDGQRRTLAAREVGLATIPVYVLPATAADQSAEIVERIAHQIVTNDQRTDLTDAQRARGNPDCRLCSQRPRHPSCYCAISGMAREHSATAASRRLDDLPRC